MAWLTKWLCRHRDIYRERHDGRLVMVCAKCARAFPGMHDEAKAARLKKRLAKSKKSPLVTKKKAPYEIVRKQS